MAYYRKEDLRVRKSKSNKTNNITDSNIYTPKENISGKRSYRKKKNYFNDYSQLEYDYEELEQMLLASQMENNKN